MRADIWLGGVTLLMAVVGGVVSIQSPRALGHKIACVVLFVVSRLLGMFCVITLSNETAAANAALTLNIQHITGGDSFAYLIPQPNDASGRVPFAVRNAGKDIVTGVRVTVYDALSDQPFNGDALAHPPEIQVGTLSPEEMRLLNLSVLPLPEKRGEHMYMFAIYAQNGIVDETVIFRPHRIGDRSENWDDKVVAQRRQKISEIGPNPPLHL